MLFNFTLLPLNEIQPWGEPGQGRLHWFGLTDSQYWIEVGEARLLEYSEAARQHGATRFCDYQAVRLYEDVIDLARYVLEPIPSDLAPLVAGQGRMKTRGCISAWCDKNSDRADDDHYWAVTDAGSTWISVRELDSAYLTPSADIIMWSDESMVHIEWDNRDKLVNGTSAWTALFGRYSLTRSDFVAECQSFHERLMDAMSERINQVVAGVLSPAIQIDLEGLVREHDRRRHLSPLNFGALPSPTDWAAVREAMRTIGA
jgi:hypothetical protein